MIVRVPVSVGELIDKITILEIKLIKITDASKLKDINLELKLLKKVLIKNKIKITKFKKEYDNLKKINLKLLNIQKIKRKAEINKMFDNRFIQLAMKVYLFNDKRALLKKSINTLTGSKVTETKSYHKY